jgi:Tol biopolymer transport system component
VFVVSGDGSDPRRITTEPLPDGSQFAWTPDGRHLAVIHKVATTGCAVTVCFANQLDLFDATGSGSVERVASAAGIDSIQFRPPDGREILFRALVNGKYGLFAMDADRAKVRPLVKPTIPQDIGLGLRGAVYSADGNRIFYQYADTTGCCRLWVMNADGTDQHEFMPLGPAWDGEAIVSPDGTRIAYWHHANDGPQAHGISVVRADGTGRIIETGPKLPGTAHWVWSPDSSKILMYPNDATNAQAYLLDPEGGQWTTVPWASDADLDWQRNAP